LVQGSNENIISGQVTSFKECPTNVNYVVPDTIHIWESAEPSPKTAYTTVAVNGTNNGLDMDSHYRERINMVAYDNAGNIQTVAKTNDANVTYLWGYNNARPVAQIVNAGLNMVAYSSFESDGKGNWSYAGTPVNTQAAKTGEFYYPLTGGNITRQLPAGKYKLEYWAKGTVNLSGGTITTIRTSSPDANGWTLYEKEVVMGATTTLTVSGGSGAYVDELRVYPTDAQMTTYTYDPLIGITSVTDPSNFTTYYEYDAFGRLMFVKDKDGYVQKMNEYNYRFK
jgi:YD repeat-containing protein